MNKQGRYFPGKGRYESDSESDSGSESDKDGRKNEKRVSNGTTISSVSGNIKHRGLQSGSNSAKKSQLVSNDNKILRSKTPVKRSSINDEDDQEADQEEDQEEEETSSESSEDEDEEDEEDEETSSSEEEYTKPVFISRNKRNTTANTTKTKVIKQEQDNSSNESNKSHATAFREIERSVNIMAHDDSLTRKENSIDVVENVEGLDDTDDVDPALEYSLWKQREMARLKRDRDVLIQQEREREEREEREQREQRPKR
ncbi:unnamed protein product [[Candida] boidinii]|nr:unnamed protein product [[Candida] boidinii]